MIVDCRSKVLRKNHTACKPARMLFLDCETKPSRKGRVEYHKMRMAWTLFWQPRQQKLADTETWTFHTKVYLLMKYIEGLSYPKTTLYVFAHNAFFDLQSSEFYYFFSKWGWKLKFTYEQGQTYILVIQKEKCTIKVISTTNYFSASVKELGVLLGLPKRTTNPLTASFQELKAYCHRDVEIIFKAMQFYLEFITKHNLGRFSMTKSSQAFNAYRHRFMSAKIWIHTTDPVKKLERSAYMGGRVECFRLGKQKRGPFASLDVNSMYPFIMRNNLLPCKLTDYQEDVPLRAVKEILKNRCVVAEITVSTKIPVFAVKREKKIIYPIGEFRCFVNTPGLQFAIKRGQLKAVHKLASYKQANLFADYVDFFYGLKQQYEKEDNGIMRTLSKYLLNTLYGKFAQRLTYESKESSDSPDDYFRIDTWDLVTGEKEITYKMFNTLVTIQGQGEGKNTLVAISSHITEYARFYLWEIIEQVGLENTLYCDTDSIKIKERHISKLDSLIDPERLGALKLEKVFKEFQIWGPKSYRADGITTLKGVPKRSEIIGPMLFRYPCFTKQTTHMREGVKRDFMVRYVDKQITSNYDKGVVHPDGSITPFVLSIPLKPALPLSPVPSSV